MSERVVIYYDGNCGFCRKWVRIIPKALLLSRVEVTPGQNDPKVWNEIKQKDSWIVIDAGGTHHYGFDAAATLVAASPVFFVFAPCMRTSLISKIGERYYRHVAARRSWF